MLALPKLHVEISPPDGSPYVLTQLIDVDLGARPQLAFQLDDPVDLTASIVDERMMVVDSTLTILAGASIPGRAATTSRDFRAAAQKSQSVMLLPGQYEALVAPVDQRPGLETMFTVRGPAGEVHPKQFVITPYRRLYGYVASSVSNDQKFPSVMVRAFSISSGLASTTTVTGAGGAYSIDLPDTDDDAFRLVATPGGAGPAWGYEEIVNVGDPVGRNKNIPLEPTSADIVGKARIRIGGAGQGFVPIADATVTLTASHSAGLDTRSFSVRGTTDADGYVVFRADPGVRELSLLKSQYLVDIEPPLNSVFARTSTTRNFTKLGPDYLADEQIVLPLRIKVGGTIVSDLGRPVSFASLEFRPVGGANRSVQARSGANGTFEAPLEPGAYLLIVNPRGTTDTNELPPVAVVQVEVPEDMPRLALPPVTLPKSALVTGSVTGLRSGGPVPNSTVEFFFEVQENVVSLGSATTDGKGVFNLVLPAEMHLE
jgi:hypothetical protein